MEKNVYTAYSADDSLYGAFGKDFVKALHDGVLVAEGKRSGRPAVKLVDELKEYVREERAREQ